MSYISEPILASQNHTRKYNILLYTSQLSQGDVKEVVVWKVLKIVDGIRRYATMNWVFISILLNRTFQSLRFNLFRYRQWWLLHLYQRANKNKPSNYYRKSFILLKETKQWNVTIHSWDIFSNNSDGYIKIITQSSTLYKKILTIKPQRTRMKTITTWRKLRFSSPFKSIHIPHQDRTSYSSSLRKILLFSIHSTLTLF